MTQKKEQNPSKSCNSSVHNFFTGLGSLLTGLGTFFLGIAACIALFKTDTVLEKIFKIQEMAENTNKTAENIDEAVGELKKGNTQIMTAVGSLETSVDNLRAERREQTATNVSSLASHRDNQQLNIGEKNHSISLPPTHAHKNHDKEKEKSPNTSKIDDPNLNKRTSSSGNLEGLKKYLRVDDQNRKRGDIYLPKKDFEKLEQEFTAKSPEEIRDFLRDKLQFWEDKNTSQ